MSFCLLHGLRQLTISDSRSLCQISKLGILDYGTGPSTIRPQHSVHDIQSSQKIHHSSLHDDFVFVSKTQISLVRFIILSYFVKSTKIFTSPNKMVTQEDWQCTISVTLRRFRETIAYSECVFVCVCVCVYS